MKGHLEGEQPHLGDLRSPWSRAISKPWDDSPNRHPGSRLESINYLLLAKTGGLCWVIGLVWGSRGSHKK